MKPVSCKLFLFSFLLFFLSSFTLGGWIDPDTKKEFYTTKSFRSNQTYSLVFSDEFDVPGRDFRDGKDPKWTAIHKDDYTNFALQYYNSSLVTTKSGSLHISTIVKDISFTSSPDPLNPSKKIKKVKNYQSGMVQGWNKFCFTGGIIEISAKLPGKGNVGGLWPALWLLGNLARATYVGSSNNMWPWSYNKCSKELQFKQRISACNQVNHYNLHRQQGRGAPEIDILEAMPGTNESLPRTRTKKPYYSLSLQVSPGLEWSGERPQTGFHPNPKKWYWEDLAYGRNTSLNIFFYGMYLESPQDVGVAKPDGISDKRLDRSYYSDAISANRNLEEKAFQKQSIYRIEWVPGEKGYLSWYLDDEFVYSMEASTLSKSGALIPEEPMYLIMNTAISSTWGFPSPCPQGCPCDCFDCRKEECQCAIPEGMCENFPADFEIDYVRVYQDLNDTRQELGCDTKSHPTKTFIDAHSSLYKMSSDKQMLLPIQSGGGSCSKDSDCGRGGTCTSKVKTCKCAPDNSFTGPHCKAANGFDDFVNNYDEPFTFYFFNHFPSGLIASLCFLVVLLSLVIFFVYKQNKDKKLTRSDQPYLPIPEFE